MRSMKKLISVLCLCFVSSVAADTVLHGYFVVKPDQSVKACSSPNEKNEVYCWDVVGVPEKCEAILKKGDPLLCNVTRL